MWPNAAVCVNDGVARKHEVLAGLYHAIDRMFKSPEKKAKARALFHDFMDGTSSLPSHANVDKDSHQHALPPGNGGINLSVSSDDLSCHMPASECVQHPAPLISVDSDRNWAVVYDHIQKKLRNQLSTVKAGLELVRPLIRHLRVWSFYGKTSQSALAIPNFNSAIRSAPLAYVERGN